MSLLCYDDANDSKAIELEKYLHPVSKVLPQTERTFRL
jgi:hypothetical protein